MARAKRDADGLTPKERAYVEARTTGGMGVYEAYNAAYGNEGGKESTRRPEASRKEKTDNIAAMIAKHREISAKMAELNYSMDANALIAAASSILADPATSAGVKLGAIDRIAKLAGLYQDHHDISMEARIGLSLEEKEKAVRAAILEALGENSPE